MEVLVAYDGSKPARKAVEHAFSTYPDAEIVLLRVIEAADSSTEAGIGIVQEMLREREEELSEEFPDEIEAITSDPDVAFRTETVVGKPEREIVEFAEEHDVDHVVIGSHGRSGLSRVLLGNVAEKVVRRAPMPVTVIR